MIQGRSDAGQEGFRTDTGHDGCRVGWMHERTYAGNVVGCRITRM